MTASQDLATRIFTVSNLQRRIPERFQANISTNTCSSRPPPAKEIALALATADPAQR